MTPRSLGALKPVVRSLSQHLRFPGAPPLHTDRSSHDHHFMLLSVKNWLKSVTTWFASSAIWFNFSSSSTYREDMLERECYKRHKLSQYLDHIYYMPMKHLGIVHGLLKLRTVLVKFFLMRLQLSQEDLSQRVRPQQTNWSC